MRTNGSGTLDCDIKLCNSLCCRNCAVLTADELTELVADVRKEYALELDPGKYFREAKGEHGIYYAVKMIRGQCIFLNKEKRCRIYRCRPALCELYPVVDVDSVDERCPVVHKLPQEKIAFLKRKYADEVDERIQKEQKFMFV
ncbi:MAG: YkgJ family cysteine cluster protein [Candidatus Methanoperedens sp.]|nr:YkgJ family cysteine cluster protein [Candidatus Methanoperedens sp.]